jgi:hypothetical protein
MIPYMALVREQWRGVKREREFEHQTKNSKKNFKENSHAVSFPSTYFCSL